MPCNKPLLRALRMMASGGQSVPAEYLADLKQYEDRRGNLMLAETQVANLVADQLIDKEIADQLEWLVYLSPQSLHFVLSMLSAFTD